MRTAAASRRYPAASLGAAFVGVNPLHARSALPESFRAELPGYGVAGWLIVRDARSWRTALEAFARPYPALDEADRAWLAEIESLRRARFEPAPQSRLHVRFSVRNISLKAVFMHGMSTRTL